MKTLFVKRCRRVGEDALWVVKETIRSFDGAHAAQAAAGIAYYAIFSLFPLLILLVTASSFFLTSSEAYHGVMDLISKFIPVSQDLIEGNISQVLRYRNALGLIGLVGLFWSASSVFSALARNINLAWDGAKRMSFLRTRLVAFEMIALLAVLLVVTIGMTTVAKLLPHLQVSLWNGFSVNESQILTFVSNSASFVFVYLLFLGLYRWIPNTKVRWFPALWSALIATLAWQAATNGFTWYLRTGLGRYEMVYGSLGAVIALLILIYISGWITLFGAHLCSALSHLPEKPG
jgi:membrane protein